MNKETKISTPIFISICLMIIGLCFLFFMIGTKYAYVDAVNYANEQYLENCWETKYGVNEYNERIKQVFNFSNINIT